jgi:hypothetical protein
VIAVGEEVFCFGGEVVCEVGNFFDYAEGAERSLSCQEISFRRHGG